MMSRILGIPLILILMSLSLANSTPTWPVLKLGTSNANVVIMQYLLRYRGYSIAVDGIFGSGTDTVVRSFQKSNGLTIDGYAGSGTWSKLISYVAIGSNSAAVQAMQYGLLHKFNYATTIDGDFGYYTKATVKGFQKQMGIAIDGKVGSGTWQWIVGTKGTVCSGSSYVCDDDWLVYCRVGEIYWRQLCLNGCSSGKCVTKTYTSGTITAAQLKCAMPTLSSTMATSYIADLNTALQKGSLDTSGLRIATFLAQVAHESGDLKYWKELGNYCVNYEGRIDLGNTQPGDGCKYKGRGPIQLTGRSNYKAAGTAIGIDLINDPSRVEDSDVGFKTTVWYWNSRSLALHSDSKSYDYITYRINGGFNGKSDRDAKYKLAKDCLTTSTSSGFWILGTEKGWALPDAVLNITITAATPAVVNWTLSWWAIAVGVTLAVIAVILGVFYHKSRSETKTKNAVIRYLKSQSVMPDNFDLAEAAMKFEQENEYSTSNDLEEPLIGIQSENSEQ